MFNCMMGMNIRGNFISVVFATKNIIEKYVCPKTSPHLPSRQDVHGRCVDTSLWVHMKDILASIFVADLDKN